MNRPVPEHLISAFHDGELDPQEKLAAEELLQNSTHARQELEETERLSELLQKLPVEPAPKDLVHSIMRNAERESLIPSDSASDITNRDDTPFFNRRRMMAVAKSLIATTAMLVAVMVLMDRNAPREEMTMSNSSDMAAKELSSEEAEEFSIVDTNDAGNTWMARESGSDLKFESGDASNALGLAAGGGLSEDPLADHMAAEGAVAFDAQPAMEGAVVDGVTDSLSGIERAGVRARGMMNDETMYNSLKNGSDGFAHVSNTATAGYGMDPLSATNEFVVQPATVSRTVAVNYAVANGLGVSGKWALHPVNSSEATRQASDQDSDGHHPDHVTSSEGEPRKKSAVENLTATMPSDSAEMKLKPGKSEAPESEPMIAASKSVPSASPKPDTPPSAVASQGVGQPADPKSRRMSKDKGAELGSVAQDLEQRLSDEEGQSDSTVAGTIVSVLQSRGDDVIPVELTVVDMQKIAGEVHYLFAQNGIPMAAKDEKLHYTFEVADEGVKLQARQLVSADFTANNLATTTSPERTDKNGDGTKATALQDHGKAESPNAEQATGQHSNLYVFYVEAPVPHVISALASLEQQSTVQHLSLPIETEMNPQEGDEAATQFYLDLRRNSDVVRNNYYDRTPNMSSRATIKGLATNNTKRFTTNDGVDHELAQQAEGKSSARKTGDNKQVAGGGKSGEKTENRFDRPRFGEAGSDQKIAGNVRPEYAHRRRGTESTRSKIGRTQFGTMIEPTGQPVVAFQMPVELRQTNDVPPPIQQYLSKLSAISPPPKSPNGQPTSVKDMKPRANQFAKENRSTKTDGSDHPDDTTVQADSSHVAANGMVKQSREFADRAERWASPVRLLIVMRANDMPPTATNPAK